MSLLVGSPVAGVLSQVPTWHLVHVWVGGWVGGRVGGWLKLSMFLHCSSMWTKYNYLKVLYLVDSSIYIYIYIYIYKKQSSKTNIFHAQHNLLIENYKYIFYSHHLNCCNYSTESTEWVTQINTTSNRCTKCHANIPTAHSSVRVIQLLYKQCVNRTANFLHNVSKVS